ncbi:hypothetical protein SELMODRAFT_409541 [Selaginella moellendorffii]|uniref:NADH dehydrogenase [ubiquinone] 1 beta subcomplex subunit 8, mitochondrial n=1 Tax=Selaginella moellendorffii TaxID=88036 RepID=D8RBS7_SELML|nr:hypothetical protein SELMODRAFT_443026 [Selaginella moellendorffii]EFJ30556.1 hypothetical protein SELMODRAFT_409541 [Selaginella moellendorffii]
MAGSSGLATAAKYFSSAMRRNAAIRQPLSAMRTRSGGWGLPLPPEEEVSAPVPEEYELWWGGERVDEDPTDIDKWEALGMCCAGLSFFAILGVLAHYRAKYSKRPYPLREFPWLEEWDRLIPVEEREQNFDHPQNY